jgi:uncharacterized repeat protein (TIGR03803 family)
MRYQRFWFRTATVVAAVALSLLLTDARAAAQTETVLHSFNGVDGISPVLGLIFDASGNLYGVASEGGADGDGAVFELTPAGGGAWTETTIFSFKGGTHGSIPVGGVIFDSAGDLYGTTKLGGSKNVGVAYKLKKSHAGVWSETVLHNFGSVAGDGEYPTGSLVFDGSGNLYGTTQGGGAYTNGTERSGGTVFKLTASGTTFTESVLHSFGNGTDGASPRCNLIFDSYEVLYGTTFGGGTYGNGTVFELALVGTAWTESVLYSFDPGNFVDGAAPAAGLILDASGNLYGTNTGGYLVYANSGGTVFELSKSGAVWTEKVLTSFSHYFYSPAYPYSGLVFSSAGDLYGTNLQGNGSFGGFNGGVFELTPAGGGTWNESTIYNFDGPHGSEPAIGSLIFDSSGNLYGATQAGGANQDGAVFKIVP